ncbi:MAG: UDP-N-acetylmuramoyl-tripeptide--D-alanyl-D-alanine ligase [Candidatus Omnitrophica bacterium]|nr:UDP-N-acetylmuramoyl-tripeptide--D-alanyl-D-alanine ligase [Candidatus Omnitrophota bacterium]
MRIEEITGKPDLISIDTRTVKKGDVFFAIKGKKFDGHDFVKTAFKKGVRAAVVSKIPKNLASFKKRLIKVNNTIKALGGVAKAHRLKFKIPVIAVTGTNGKTTVKDMIGHVLSARYNVLKNETSKNNLIGLPLTLFKLQKKHDVVVLEMGMSHLGEIDRLSEIASPEIGVVTNIGPSHLKFLGTLKKVFTAKSELLGHLSKEGTAILNSDDIYLANIKGLKCKKIYFGIEKPCRFQAKDLVYSGNKWSFRIAEKHSFQLPILGRHNVYNALIAIAVARHFNIDFPTIERRISSYRHISPMRLEFKHVRGIEILDDSYNSNPLSMECAIDALLEYNADGKRIVVSGDMLELGKKAKAMHEAIGKTIASGPVDILITMGGLSKFINKGARLKGMAGLYHARSHRDAAGFLKKIAKPGDVVLVKGSRRTEMEKVIEYFKKRSE